MNIESAKRKPDESYEDYSTRITVNNQIIKRYLKGRLIKVARLGKNHPLVKYGQDLRR